MNWWKNLNPVRNIKSIEIENKISNGVKGKIKLDEPLKKHTTFKIGGPARFFAEPKDIADLKLLITRSKRFRIPIFVIGAGSNILASDKGVDGLIIQLKSPYFRKISYKQNYLKAGSGLLLNQLIRAAKQHSLSGIEFLAGIPGTLGGALIMNTGAWGRNIGDLVENVEVMDYNGNRKNLTKRNIKFAYRKSSLRKFIILTARIKLYKKSKEEISKNIKKYLDKRFNAQDNSLPNAGCIFKNPLGESAGRLIDLCGLKGKTEGGARVSLRHANFILNRKRARAKDVLQLMNLIKKKVKDKFNVTLEPEIKIWQ